MVLALFLNRTILAIALLTVVMQSEGQTTTADGFYITIPNRESCTNLVPLLIGKDDYCVSEQPIISAAEIESVTKVQINPVLKQKVMALTFSNNGFRIWKGILNNLPDALLVLVMDGYVVATFKNEGAHQFNTIPITAPAESMELEWIYDHLKK